MAAEITDLYRKRSSLNEFLQGNALNLEIHRLYDKYLKNNRGAGIPKMKELDIFNEVYYQCTAIHNSAILLSTPDKNSADQIVEWYDSLRSNLSSDDAAEFIASIIYGTLTLLPTPNANETQFIGGTYKLMRTNSYFGKVSSTFSEFRRYFGYVELDFSPQGTCTISSVHDSCYRESQEYKQAVAEMKAQLGRSHISFQKIAECILRLPTYDSQYTAFQQVNALLTGTAWQEKAEDVLNQMFARVKQQTPDVKIAIKEFHNHEGGQYIDQSQTINIANPDTPKLTE